MTSITGVNVAPNPGDNGVFDNTIITTVTNSSNTGSSNTLTTTSVNVVPNTYLTAPRSTTWSGVGGINAFQTATLSAGIYTISFTGYVTVGTIGLATDYIDLFLYSSLNGLLTKINTFQLVQIPTVGTSFSCVGVLKLSTADNIQIQGNFTGTAVLISITINPYVTVQKIG